MRIIGFCKTQKIIQIKWPFNENFKLNCSIYRQFGQTGDIERTDQICLLPQNVLSEKIFSFLWIWYSGLIALSLYNIFTRIVFFWCRKARVANFKFDSELLKDRLLDVESLSTGYYMLLKLLNNNVHRPVFSGIVEELIHKMEGKSMV